MLVLAIILVAIATYFAIQGLTAGQKSVSLSLRRARSYGGQTLRDAEMGKSMSDRMVGPLAQKLAKLALRATPKGSLDDTRRKLIGAGLTKANPTTYLAGKAAVAGVMITFGAVMLVTGGSPMTAVLLGLGGAAGAFVFPDYYLSLKTRGRRESLVAQMPDILDLLTVSVEAGLGFDAAVAKVCERMQGPLVEEMRIVLHEMRIGESRGKALRNFADRLDTPETTSFARSIIQADQLGLSLGRILRVQAQDMRHRRQMAAEERAMKAPVKMLFPTAVFIFPAMFIVVLGPAMINLLKLFSG
jgi:tight adherence protein C